MAGSVLLRASRHFSGTAIPPALAARALLAGGDGVPGTWAQLLSTSAAAETKATAKGDVEKRQVVASSYWGIEQPTKLLREDGTDWKWSCFRPREEYAADTSIDLTKHHVPNTLLHKMAYWTVKSLRFPTDVFFQAMSSRMARSVLLRYVGSRHLFAAPATSPAAVAGGPLLAGGNGVPASMWARLLSTSTAAEAKGTANGDGEKKKKEVAVNSYWGIEQSEKLVREDGTEWKWSCIRPWDTYKADTSIDVGKHHEPKALHDKVAYAAVRSLRVPMDLFFQRRHASHALLLETVAAVPGMVGGMLLHLRSLRRFEQSGGWIRALLEEAENERMHLMTFLEVTQPRWWERALVLAAQGVFFNAYFVGYLISPKFAHRFVGYLEEEAVHSYTEYLKDLEAGKVENVPAPAIAIDYWRLPADATLKDVVTVVRADEAHHRDVNHFASDIQYQGMKLKETPAPLGYH